VIKLPTEDEPVKVVCGDAAEVLPQLPAGCVGAILTDPPYSGRTHRGHDASAKGHQGEGKDGANRKSLGYAPWTDADVARFVPEMCRVCSGWVAIMTDHTLAPCIGKALDECGRYVFAPLPFYAPGSRCRLSGDGPSSWTDWIIVARTAKQLRWGTLPGGYLASGPGWREKEHMGGKPVALMRALIRDYSREGDLILDPFGGSGTTAVAALHEGRRCLIIEKDPTYIEIIKRRVAEAMGEGKGSLLTPTTEPDLFAEVA
jgi:site-specific DNA-methyltransferase (adenine-specific)